jgi:hypothetical protein
VLKKSNLLLRDNLGDFTWCLGVFVVNKIYFFTTKAHRRDSSFPQGRHKENLMLKQKIGAILQQAVVIIG